MVLNSKAGGGKSTAHPALALLCICALATAHGQSSTHQGQNSGSAPSPVQSSGGGVTRIDPGMGTSPTDSAYEEPQSMRVLRQNARRDDIKKRMEQNATRLLLLTAELRNDLQTREPTEADNKRLDEIAKLAHAVREQMKQ